MAVRGAPLIGICGAYAVAAAAEEFKNNRTDFYSICDNIRDARPTAVNLSWAVKQQLHVFELYKKQDNITELLFENADKLAEEDAENCRKIGQYGFEIIKNLSEKKKSRLNILTHCNAGWLAAVDYGTALAPIYEAWQKGIDLHVYADETRPRNQGSSLTAFELQEMRIPTTVIVDNAGGLLMMNNQIDLVLVGADRISLNGDVINKIGTYLKALAAKANQIPFYVAAPISTIDFNSENFKNTVKIEERSGDEVRFVNGLNENNTISSIRIVPQSTQIYNPGFDISPADLISGIITEKGIVKAEKFCILELDKKSI